MKYYSSVREIERGEIKITRERAREKEEAEQGRENGRVGIIILRCDRYDNTRNIHSITTA